jgi:hypothetical protein
MFPVAGKSFLKKTLCEAVENRSVFPSFRGPR